MSKQSTEVHEMNEDEMRAACIEFAHTGRTCVADTLTSSGTREVRGVVVGRVIGVASNSVVFASGDRVIVITLGALLRIAALTGDTR